MWSTLSDLPPPPDLSAACGTRPQKIPPRAPKPAEAKNITEAPNIAEAKNITEAPNIAEAKDITEAPNITEAVLPAAPAASGATDWDLFSQRRLFVSFSRGAAVLSGFPAAAPGAAARRVVNMEVWNAYWSAFSDCFAEHIDAVQEQIAAQSGPRRVLIAASLAEERAIEEFKEQLTRHARTFGALEYISRERVVVILQFTCARAAETFGAWASSLTLAELHGNTAAADEAGRLFVRLVAPDTSRVTTTVRLGESILLSTGFVEGVFKGIFDAAHVMYEAGSGSFKITFDSTAAAAIAVHSLQRSLLEVFGLSLVFVNETQPLCQ